MSKKLSTMVTKLNIMGFDIKVDYQEELELDGCPCYGCYLPSEDRIVLLHGDSISHEKQIATLLHEAVECLVDKMEMGTKHRDITTFESFMFTFMRNNPEVARAFTLYIPKETKEVVSES